MSPTASSRTLHLARSALAGFLLPFLGCTSPAVLRADSPLPEEVSPAPAPDAGAAAPGVQAPVLPEAPPFHGSHRPIPDAMKRRMRGVSWREGCPVPLEQLSLVTVSFWNFTGEVERGNLIVARTVADSMVTIFKRLYEVRFPIARMVPVDAYGGDDDRSMEANNTSAFNCRKNTGGQSLSQHAYGMAVDLNPIQNPYVKGEKVHPVQGRSYVSRQPGIPGVIYADGPVVEAFTAEGFMWGGAWHALKDYQHFSIRGN